MKTFLAIICFSLPFALAGAEMEEVSMKQALSDVLGASRVMKGANSCEVVHDGTEVFYDSFRRDPFPWDHRETCNPLSLDRVCTYAKSLCQKSYGDSGCAVKGGPEIQERRMAKPALKKQIYKKAKDYFDSLVKSPAILEECCGSDQKCRTHFGKTGFTLMRNKTGKGLGSRVFQFYDSKVQVSELSLLELYNEEAMEWLLAHELGHACQSSRQHTGR